MRSTLIIVLLFVLLAFNNTPLQKEAFSSELTESQNTHQIESGKLDRRAKILADYLAVYNSPLQYQAQDFIDAADEFEVDWMLVPAIAGVESTFGKFIPGGYNAWGWGIYGDNRLGFQSWREGIFTVTGGLKKNYIDKGLTEPYAMNKVYAASPHWGWKVSYFLEDIKKFANQHALSQSENRAKAGNPLNKTAATSARIVMD